MNIYQRVKVASGEQSRQRLVQLGECHFGGGRNRGRLVCFVRIDSVERDALDVLQPHFRNAIIGVGPIDLIICKPLVEHWRDVQATRPSMVPDSGAYESVRDQLTSEALSQLVSDGASEDVDLTLPKFKVQSIVPAAQTLQELGMARPFDPNTAEFPKLVSELYPVVYISDVLHQATVTIDEKGTEASAATAILTAGLSIGPIEQPQPKVVNVDRPFLFTIRDNPTGAVLFLGQIVRP